MPTATQHSAIDIWDAALAQLVLRVTRQNFENWLRHTAGIRFDGTTLVVSTPTDLARDWLATRMRPIIHQAVTAIAGPGLDVHFETTVSSSQDRLDPPLQPSLVAEQSTPPNPRLTFSTLIGGEFNRLATTVTLDVVTDCESPYSPVFISGATGAGKTHLLHAIAHRARELDQRYLLVTADQFVSDFTGAIRNKSGPIFRARYRELDLLLVDDVHILVGKKASQAEFFQTVSALHDHGRRVVVAGDHDALMCEAGARFESPLRWGLVATIEEPDIRDRVRFLEDRVRTQGISLDAEVLHYIALRVKSSFRDLEGAINRVIAHARIAGTPMTIDLAARALRPISQMPLNTLPAVQPSTILTAACQHLAITSDVIRSARRDRAATYARHIVMYLMRSDGGMTYSAIASLLNKKDHSTVVHACTQIGREQNLDSGLRADIDAIRSVLRRGPLAA